MKPQISVPDSFPVGTTFFETFSGDTFVYFPDGSCARLTTTGMLAPCMSVSRIGDPVS